MQPTNPLGDKISLKWNRRTGGRNDTQGSVYKKKVKLSKLIEQYELKRTQQYEL